MTAFCVITGGLIFTVLVVLLGLYDKSSSKSSREMTQEELENYQQKMQQIYGPILDAVDPQRIEEKRQEKLMNDYEYFMLMGELPPTE